MQSFLRISYTALLPFPLKIKMVKGALGITTLNQAGNVSLTMVGLFKVFLAFYEAITDDYVSLRQVTLNNLHATCENIQKLKRDLGVSTTVSQHYVH